MDHLRSVVGLRSFAQEDPEDGLQARGHERIRHDVGQRSKTASPMPSSAWKTPAKKRSRKLCGPASMPAMPQANPYVQSVASQQNPEQQSTNQSTEKKKEPIRNRTQKVGRNDRVRAAAARSTRTAT